MTTTEPNATGTTTPPANWYPDPSGRHRVRWWDGRRWTEQVADGTEIVADPPVRRPEPAVGAGPAVAPTTVTEPERPMAAAPQSTPTRSPEERPRHEPVDPARFEAAEREARALQAAAEGPAGPAAVTEPIDPARFDIAEREAQERLAAEEAAATTATDGGGSGGGHFFQPIDPARFAAAEREAEERLAATVDTEPEPPRDPLGGFEQLEERKSRRLPPEARPSTAPGAAAPAGKGLWIGFAAAAAVVLAALGAAYANHESAAQWRDRSEQAEAELADRISNYDALEQSLGTAASRSAGFEDDQETMAEMRDATRQVVDGINQCADDLNVVIATAGTAGEQEAIDRANSSCGAAAVNGEQLSAILDELTRP